MKPRIRNEFQAKLNHIDGSRLPEGTVDTGFVEKLAIRGEVVDPLTLQNDILEIAFDARPRELERKKTDLEQIRKALSKLHEE